MPAPWNTWALPAGQWIPDRKPLPRKPWPWVFLGQFVDHDIILDVTTSLDTVNSGYETRNARTPTLDLDRVYGMGSDFRTIRSLPAKLKQKRTGRCDRPFPFSKGACNDLGRMSWPTGPHQSAFSTGCAARVRARHGRCDRRHGCGGLMQSRSWRVSFGAGELD